MATRAAGPTTGTRPFKHTTTQRAFKRLTTLLRLTDGAWALGALDHPADARRFVAALRAALTPLPVVQISLARSTPDPLMILRGLDAPAPVVCLTNVAAALPDLYGYLDLQREALARLPHRLLLLVSEDERRALAEHAPNFYSRLSGTFYLSVAALAGASKRQPTPV